MKRQLAMSAQDKPTELRAVIVDIIADSRQIVADDGASEEYVVPCRLMERLCVAAGFSGIAEVMRVESENWNRAHG